MPDIPNILDHLSGPLLKSGQTTDRTPAGRTTKDDGGFQRGIVGSKLDDQYEIFTTGQFSGTTNITVNSIVNAHTNECVFDKITGLFWNSQNTELIYGTGAQGLLWDGNAASDEDIFEYCDQANLQALSGFTDWRVPNGPELLSLPDYNSSVANSAPNATAFPNWTLNEVWCSTTSPLAAGTGFFLRFITGHFQGATKTSSRFQSALVRLGIDQA